MEDVIHGRELAAEAATRTRNLIAILRDQDPVAFDAPSELPGWTRLTIVCHLRYGATALLGMTRDALAGRETSYYPEGRERQRPKTLVPGTGERPVDVLDAWQSAAAELDEEWSMIDQTRWGTPVVEPADNADLGAIPLARLALARLTEVEVHGTDLGIGAPEWSRTLTHIGLPTRLEWLRTRRVNHRAFDQSLRGSWLLAPSDGRSWLVTVDGPHVQSRPADLDDNATAVIKGSSRDLLALLLGRPPRESLRYSGDVQFAESFTRAFPGP